MKKKVTPVMVIFLLVSFLTSLQTLGKQREGSMSVNKRIYTTKRADPAPPVVDGRVSDPVWESVPWSGDFIQREPDDGGEPSHETVMKILYDADHLYVAVRAFDPEPGKIEKRLARRDHFAGDWVEINIDSYFDHRTAFSFTVTVAGGKGDEAISNNGDRWDSSWNPIWHARTNVDEKGWTAEMKIPFSQLRFGNKEEQVWGIQLTRRLFRKDERSTWQHIPRNAGGWVHLFGELRGIKNINSKRQVELTPYSVGKYQTFEEEIGNPFATGRSSGLNGGLDGKIGVTSDLTLDFTINPDFGQVEADPSEVNLTAFETFFPEKRPFFIEGKNILNFQITSGDGGFSRDNLFYSRRIGRTPHYYPDTGDDEYVKFPTNTKILAAAKLTGKTKKGLSVAVMESLTAKENAQIDFLGQRRNETAEPFTNYFSLRMQQDYRNGDTRIGGMFTSTHRNLSEDHLDFLHGSAYTGGVDISHGWKDKTYFFSFKTLFSHVRGSKEAILETQESSRRYYQRPDADHLTLDPERTSLSGHGGTIEFSRSGRGRLKFSSGFTWRSPGLELNDVGFLRAADRSMQWLWVGYRIWKPFSIFRRFNLNFNQWQGWDFGGARLFLGANISFNTMFKNYWNFNYGINRNFEGISTTDLRGGPSIIDPGGWNQWMGVSTDQRQKITFHLRFNNSAKDDNAGKRTSLRGGVEIHPTNALTFSFFPSVTWYKNKLQYVDTVDYGNQSRYILGSIDQKTLALTIRLDWTLTPDLTIQFYGQPFISAGNYRDFKYVTNPRAAFLNDRFHVYGGKEISYDGEEEIYNLDENGDGNSDYSFDQPNFNFLQFRSNLVLRWEYKPGSTVYLVWSQGRTDIDSRGEFSFSNDFRNLFKITPHNVFLVKFTHRFNL